MTDRVRIIPDPNADHPLFLVCYWVPTHKLTPTERRGLKAGTAEVVRTFGIVQAPDQAEALRLAQSHESMPTSATRAAAYPCDETETPLFNVADPRRREPVKHVRQAV